MSEKSALIAALDGSSIGAIGKRDGGRRRSSYIEDQLLTINSRLQQLYDELGMVDTERSAKERELYSTISQALENYVTKVQQERDEVVERCTNSRLQLSRTLNILKDIEFEPSDPLSALPIQPPLLPVCKQLEILAEQVLEILHNRLDKSKALRDVLLSHLDKMDGIDIDRRDPLSLSVEELINSDVDCDLSNESLVAMESDVQICVDEYSKRVGLVQAMAGQIVDLYAQLGTGQDEIDRSIITALKDNAEAVGLNLGDIERLRHVKSTLQAEKQSRLDRCDKLLSEIKTLWDKLSEDKAETKIFERNNRGISTGVIEAYENELARLHEKKRDHMQIFIEDARQGLQKLWVRLYLSEDEMLDFTPAWTDVYTDASLASHENEIARLEKLVAERSPILNLIDAYTQLMNDKKELEESQHDSSRLMARGGQRHDPTRLLREEQMRKRLTKRKPKVVADLKLVLEQWRIEHGTPFLVNGAPFIDTLLQMEAPTTSSYGQNHSSSKAQTSRQPTKILQNRTNDLVGPNGRAKSRTLNRSNIKSGKPCPSVSSNGSRTRLVGYPSVSSLSSDQSSTSKRLLAPAKPAAVMSSKETPSRGTSSNHSRQASSVSSGGSSIDLTNKLSHLNLAHNNKRWDSQSDDSSSISQQSMFRIASSDRTHTKNNLDKDFEIFQDRVVQVKQGVDRMDDSFDDPEYTAWRTEAVKRAASSPRKTSCMPES